MTKNLQFDLNLDEDPPPVSTKNPLSPIEQRVLKVWFQSSPSLQSLYRKSPDVRRQTEGTLRQQVSLHRKQELLLAGRQPEEIAEILAPGMWKPIPDLLALVQLKNKRQ